MHLEYQVAPLQSKAYYEDKLRLANTSKTECGIKCVCCDDVKRETLRELNYLLKQANM